MIRTLTAVVLSAAFLLACSSRPAEGFDVVITGGQIIDGSGRAGYRSDLAIDDDAVVRIGSLSQEEKAAARQVINAEGLTVSPGFIDIHSHSDYTLLVDGTAQSKIRQGVTTEILGESRSAAPIQGKLNSDSPYGIEVDWRTLGEYFDRLERQGISVNVGSYVGATQVRLCVLGEESREPTDTEMDEMKQLVTEAMEDGALGLSSALLVPPNTYHTTDQLAQMASMVKAHGGIYSTHIRSEGEGIQEAVLEAIEIGRRAGVPVDIIHLKIADKSLWGRMEEICGLIEAARREGLEVTANQYPYPAGQNNLVALIPPWAMEGGRKEMLERLGRPALRSRMAHDIYQGIPGWFNHYLAMGSWDGCLVASVTQHSNKQFEGKSVEEIARLTGKKPEDVVFDLLRDEEGSVPAVYFLMNDEDIKYALRMPWLSFGSDGTAVRPDGMLGEGKPHPRWYGTFPRILGKYVREEGVLTLEQAVRKMTSLNAEKLGLSDRGLLEEGKKADITIFDAATVRDRATFQDPHQYPEGIEYVIVNGRLVFEKGQHLEIFPGEVLRKRQN